MKKTFFSFLFVNLLAGCSSDAYLNFDNLSELRSEKTEFDSWLPVQFLPSSSYEFRIARSDDNDYGTIRFQYDKKDSLKSLESCSAKTKTKHHTEYRCDYNSNKILIQVADGYGKLESLPKHM